jgi:uncharacterized protein YukE
MKRPSHDLAGCGQRTAKLESQWSAEVQQLARQWTDKIGQSFLNQQLADVTPRVRLLLSELAELCESFENIARQMNDPDQP